LGPYWLTPSRKPHIGVHNLVDSLIISVWGGRQRTRKGFPRCRLGYLNRLGRKGFRDAVLVPKSPRVGKAPSSTRLSGVTGFRRSGMTFWEMGRELERKGFEGFLGALMGKLAWVLALAVLALDIGGGAADVPVGLPAVPVGVATCPLARRPFPLEWPRARWLAGRSPWSRHVPVGYRRYGCPGKAGLAVQALGPFSVPDRRRGRFGLSGVQR
jgi:hypothetical protein